MTPSMRNEQKDLVQLLTADVACHKCNKVTARVCPTTGRPVCSNACHAETCSYSCGRKYVTVKLLAKARKPLKRLAKASMRQERNNALVQLIHAAGCRLCGGKLSLDPRVCFSCGMAVCSAHVQVGNTCCANPDMRSNSTTDAFFEHLRCAARQSALSPHEATIGEFLLRILHHVSGDI
eukprot:comp24289_c0_seq2/m.45444 comp24289_c0_seq2/g.45444  ORF comp24289_c0_seq2/g.45444 comp24289_c0_seq2/m.45444 type:complete len:179 (-) comp24289_c0_seq2:1165-1701(-)